MDNLSVDFYSKSEAAVTLSCPNEISNESVKLFNSLLFACFLIRQLRNLGNHPANKALMCQVLDWTPEESQKLEAILGWTVYPEVSHKSHIIYHAALKIGIDPSHAKTKYGEEIHLIPYYGIGKKRFRGQLVFTKDRPVFFLNVEGFGLSGLIGGNIPLYATDSVFHVLTYLFKIFPFDVNFPQTLIRISQDCVKAFQNGEVNTLNQEIKALEIVSKYFINHKIY